MFRSLRTGLAAGLLCLAGAANAAAQEWFAPDGPEGVLSFLESEGYTIEEDQALWVVAPDGNRALIDFFQTSTGGMAGFRVSALIMIWDSEPAHEVALFYEETTPLASIAVQTIEGESLVRLQRDILFGSGRTPENVARNVELLFQLLPYFETALVEADPTLAARWTGEAE